MNVPFSRPNLAKFIQEGSDAVVSKVTFPDGTEQTSASQSNNVVFSQNPSEGSNLSVASGNPTDPDNAFTGGDGDKGGSLTTLQQSITIPNNASTYVLIMVSVSGEWNGEPENKGMILARRTSGQSDATYLRGAADGDRALMIAPFMTNYLSTHFTSTPENCSFIYIDTVPAAGATYDYVPVLVNSTEVNTRTFRPQSSGTTTSYLYQELYVSSMVLQHI